MTNQEQQEEMNKRFDEQWEELRLKDDTTYEEIPADVQLKSFIQSEIDLALDNHINEVTHLIVSQIGCLRKRGQDYTQLQELYKNLNQAGLI